MMHDLKWYKKKNNSCISRRDFVRGLSCGFCSLGITSNPFALKNPFSPMPAYAAEPADTASFKEVMFYKRLEDLKIECGICPKKCRIADLERGYCGNKENRAGTYYSLVYSQPCAVHVDPIEKKPLFHYLPSTMAFSIATAGCNFECRFCQNWRIAQYRPEQIESVKFTPDEIVSQCIKKNCSTIAYTYTEPVVFYDYMFDCARKGRPKGIGSVMISNGFINEAPLKKLCKQLTGVKIDLKAFTDKFYREYCSGELEPVLHTLKTLKEIGTWFEIVVLIIPTLNDSPGEIKRMCEWIVGNLGNDVPLHFSRFHPMYKIKNLPPTPLKTLESCHAIAKATGLHHVYIGNIPGHPAENTYCPGCNKIVIRRISYSILENRIKEGKCPDCGTPIPGVWKQKNNRITNREQSNDE
jgi:pyruvate formate lyase activating enzyme